MKDIISYIHPKFYGQISTLDNASCSNTERQVRTWSLVEAEGHPAAKRHDIKVIAVWDPSPLNNCYQVFIGIDPQGEIYHSSLMHGKSSWFGLTDEQKDHTELKYDMEWCWCHSGSDGPMCDEFWSDLASIGVDVQGRDQHHSEY